MKHRCLCDTVEFVLACLSATVFAGLSCGCLRHQKYIHGIFFILLVIIYGNLAVRKGSLVVINEKGVERRIFRRRVLFFSWSEIQEAGLINSRFVYFSRDKMTEAQRADMCFAWPPKDKIYFRAGKKVSASVELLCNRKEKVFSQYQSRRLRK